MLRSPATPEPPVVMANQSNPVPAAGYARWGVCALLFFATTINYIDRQVIGILKPVLTQQYHWSQQDYGTIIMGFQLAYAIGLVAIGWLLDRIGARLGFMLAVGAWSLAAMAHGLINHLPEHSALSGYAPIIQLGGLSVASFALARFALGVAEAANFPASIRVVAEWFPKKERALATGVFNAGANIGAIITPLLVPVIWARWGWPAAFYFTGGLGVFWLIAWAKFYHDPAYHPRLSAAERAYIGSDREAVAAKVPWHTLLGYRQTWAFALGKFLTDPIWWFYLFWIPDFLFTQYKLDLQNFGPPLVVIYLMTDVGSIAGGWLSSGLIKRGWTVNAARKTTMLICAMCVVPIVFAAHAHSLWAAVLLIGLAASAHQGWSCNLFTLVSDTAPRQAISSITGLGGMFGAVGGLFIAKLVGYVLDRTHNNYLLPFVIAASAYLAALAVIQLFSPRLEPMKLPAAGAFPVESRPPA